VLNACIYSNVCEPAGAPGAISRIVPNPETLVTVVVEQWLLIRIIAQEDVETYEPVPTFHPEQ